MGMCFSSVPRERTNAELGWWESADMVANLIGRPVLALPL
jgi:hypothetical protein